MTKVKQIIEYCRLWNITIVSYGLAPNPNGFCFEKPDSVSDSVAYKLDKMLNALNSDEEVQLRKAVM